MTLDTDLCLAVDGDETGFPDLQDVKSWCRALALGALVPGRCRQPPAADLFQETLATFTFPAVRNVFADSVQGAVNGATFTSPRDDEAQVAVHSASRSCRMAQSLGSRHLVLELGPLRQPLPKQSPLEPVAPAPQEQDASPVTTADEFHAAAEAQFNVVLDQVCRRLFEVCRQVPEVRLAIATPAALPELPTPDMLEALLEDLAGRHVGYWHDTGRARRLAHQGVFEEEVWLDRFGSYCVGADLTDCMEAVADLPAGSGEVDFVAVREALGQDTILVVRADPFPGPAPLLAAVDFLRGKGF